MTSRDNFRRHIFENEAMETLCCAYFALDISFYPNKKFDHIKVIQKIMKLFPIHLVNAAHKMLPCEWSPVSARNEAVSQKEASAANGKNRYDGMYCTNTL